MVGRKIMWDVSGLNRLARPFSIPERIWTMEMAATEDKMFARVYILPPACPGSDEPAIFDYPPSKTMGSKKLLEEVFNVFNNEIPEIEGTRSMAIGDIVQIGTRFWVCAHKGWIQISEDVFKIFMEKGKTFTRREHLVLALM